MSDSLNEKVNYILEDSDFNDLPFEERKRIGKYMAEQQILTLHQVINKDKAHTTEAWRKKTTSWLKNCVDTFYKEYRYPADRKTENSSEKPNNCEDLQDWKDRMWAEAIVTEQKWTCARCGCENYADFKWCFKCGCHKTETDQTERSE